MMQKLSLRMSWRTAFILAVQSAEVAGRPEADELIRVDRHCSGFDEEFGLCSLKPCDDSCVPKNCAFGAWGQWSDFGGCSGLLGRSRDVEEHNNECGMPCDGATEETMKVPKVKDECIFETVDCVWDSWGAWSSCSGEFSGQRFRERKIGSSAANGGIACEGEARETAACAMNRPPVDCELSDWQEWTSCTATCGYGRHTRMRRVLSGALFGGVPCVDTLVMTEECMTKCEVTDCKFSDWTDWSVCDFSHEQKFRDRHILLPASGGGKLCEGELQETLACVPAEPQDCSFGEWDAWSKCDAHCSGGQTFRKRELLRPQTNGGTCTFTLTEETKACNTQPCLDVPKPCEFDDWTEWGTCSVVCGLGESTRMRTIKQNAEEGALGCLGPLTEMKSCQATEMCNDVDCKWGEWEQWSGCTCSCGGGDKSRVRVVVQAPHGKGKPCEALPIREVTGCNTQSCETVCLPGEWGEWSHWSGCSASCGTAYKSRNREVKRQPDACALPVEGLRSEYSKCDDLPKCHPDVDCTLSAWAEWSDCSCSCFGTRERSRVIKTFVSGAGKPCINMSLKESSSCNPLPGLPDPDGCGEEPLQDCVWDEWSSLSECSRSCGGGQQEKVRTIKLAAVSGGKPCEGAQSITTGCNTDSCEAQDCVDCKWGDWGRWSDCETGQRVRRRNVETTANYCGKPCEETVAVQAESCASAVTADVLVCRWSSWSKPSTCDGLCGPTSQFTNRVLGFQRLNRSDASSNPNVFFEGRHDAVCSGTQVQLNGCQYKSCTPKCVPQDCVWQEWGDWSAGSCLGLCERKREIETINNDCGHPCSGPLIETKACQATCDVVTPCMFYDWSEWSACKTPLAQKKRTRSIKQNPQNGGLPCDGTLDETAPCGPLPKLENCELAEWEDWAVCPSTCGGSTQTRKRRILQQATLGGLLCLGALTEFQPCGVTACPSQSVDCKFSEWSAFAGCGPQMQMFRQRKILRAAVGDGVPCKGHLGETRACKDKPVDCVMSDWTSFDACDKTCGGGQRQRSRQIVVFPKLGGKACEEALVEAAGCNEKACKEVDCKVTDWIDWTACSVTCGVGQRTRSRELETLHGGASCDQNLAEVESCLRADCEKPMDCAWRDWEEWSACSNSCAGGMRSRKRIIGEFASAGGKPCSESAKDEVEACNTQRCQDCIDGKWGAWTPWSSCSAECIGGVQFRTRKMEVPANHCGLPALGLDREVQFCNQHFCDPNVDCKFSAWEDWGACSMACDGMKRRGREIAAFGRAGGKFCEGDVKQVSPCNPSLGEERPEGCRAVSEPVDCVLEAFGDWTKCSATCGGGLKERRREIKSSPKNGGKACEDSLHEVRECARDACELSKVVDCELGEWEDWGACSKCGDQRKRFRQVKTQPLNGGTPCPMANLTEVGGCPSTCEVQTFCTWAVWDEWGPCTAKCGPAKRSRKRSLVAQKKPLLADLPASSVDLMNAYSKLKLEASDFEGSNKEELLLAFSSGGLALVFGLTSFRLAGNFLGQRRAPVTDDSQETTRIAGEI